MNIEEHTIREFAYLIWESEGKPNGHAARHWEMARKLAEGEQQRERQAAPRKPRAKKPKELAPAPMESVETPTPIAAKKPRAKKAKEDKSPQA